MDYEDLDRPVAERRTRRLNRWLPKHYRQIALKPPAPLPSLSSQPECPEAGLAVSCSSAQQSSVQGLPIRRILKSLNNAFGLYWQLSSNPPAHKYYPYPNQSSFLLEEWYWNDGEKKSQSSLQNLLKIVGHPDFHPEDIAGINWRDIDAQLSREHSEVSNVEDGWEDTQDSRSGSWIKMPIKINVPFHKRMQYLEQK